MRMPVPAGVTKVFFGRRKDCDVRLVLGESIDGGCAVRVVLERQLCAYDPKVSISSGLATELVEFEIRSPGLHLAVNACAAAAVAVSMGVSLHQVGESLSRFKPVQMRSELKIAENGIRIINDVYNSNPTSMRTAINLLKAMECRGKRVVILGDMLELGALETEAHEDVLSMCSDSCFGMVALVGKRFAAAAEKLNLVGKINIMFATDSESLSLDIKERLTANDVVLVKGSRALQMEKVVDAIKANNT
eukprot:TRINITY_DN2844_c0_g2_i2.p2 TRINITY_DN2844_c0_g2~~TRINITY_DN2844_c0_g2_i2.p2  ORF type:complete len:248 (-),score=61.19 TRINITY_DN2844_c0_g2_i2:565-1308(-)